MIPKSIDEPLTILGLAPDEIGGGGLVFLILYLQNHPGFGLLLGLLIVILLKKTKSGKNDGYLLHKIYEYGLPLPGLLPPYVNHFED